MPRWKAGARPPFRGVSRLAWPVSRCGLTSNSKPIAAVGSQVVPGKPVILAVDDDPLALDRVLDELRRRYSRDYEVAGEISAEAALSKIDSLATGDQPLALVLADQWLREPHVTGETLLARTRELH